MSKFYVKDMISKGLLPESTPHICECGEELLVNDTFTYCWCSDKECPTQIAYKLLEVFSIFRMKCNVGEIRAKKLAYGLGIKNPMEIFRDNLDEVFYRIGDQWALDVLTETTRVKNEEMSLSMFIDAMQIPSLGTTRSNLIFSNYSTVEEFYDSLKIDFEAELLYEDRLAIASLVAKYIKVDKYSDTVSNIVDDLLDYREDLLKFSKYFKFKESFGETVYVTLTGEIKELKDDDGKPFKPRERLCEYLSDKLKINVVSQGLSEKHIQYLVMDTDMTNNRKYKMAKSKGIEVVTSKQLYDILKGGTDDGR